ncbi:serine hydroxymethyltransferase [Ilumatobacter sp.]|uniref:serine hydroxymethyltransferase n=1 Tax=Ilumatobacter sp. TaxID=1967498 RepID=UPI00345C74CD
MSRLVTRSWVPEASEALVRSIADTAATRLPSDQIRRIGELIDLNRRTHAVDCVNLNPATNTMSPRAEAALASGLGTRPSLGYPGAKYETGLEAIEQVEVIAAELAARVFDADFAEVRLPSGAIANLCAFMACARPGDPIIAPPATIAGHVTHHTPGAAGLYGLRVHEAPVDATRYTVNVAALAALAREVRPRVITIGGSLNLALHDVEGVRAVADDVGAIVLFDAAHLSGPIAGGAWPNPLAAGAHLMTMSAYKSLAGPPSGLLVTNDAELAQRVDRIVFPGLTANFDAAQTAALAITLSEWIEVGREHAAAMTETAALLAAELLARDVPVFRCDGTPTRSHAFAVDARTFGGGHVLARHLRRSNILVSAIGLPSGLDDGIRVGTNELVRWGATASDMPALADLLQRALLTTDPDPVAADVTAFRARFDQVHFTGSSER